MKAMIFAQLKSVAAAVAALGVVVGVFASLSATRASGEESPGGKWLTVIAEGRSEYSIVLADGEGKGGRVGKAASYLRETLREATGVALQIVSEKDALRRRPAIYLGRTSAAERAGLPLGALRGWSYLKKAKGRDIFLVGLDASMGIKGHASAQYQGTLKAVLSFLQDEVGVRFLLPGPNGIHVPRRDRLEVRADLDVKWEPVFRYCKSRPQGPAYDVAHCHFRGEFYKSYGGHSYYRAVPKKEYAETHPEYFALIGGVRNPSGGHLCVSNRDVQDLMIREMERQLDGGHDWVQLAQTDGYVPCGCASCNAISRDQGERLLIVHRKLAEIMRRRRPGKKVVILAYGPTKPPPKTFREFGDNVVIEVCSNSEEAFESWREAAQDFVVYIYNWGYYHTQGFAPKRTPRFAAEQIRMFVRNRVRGIYKCGFGENLGLEGPVYYVYGRLMQDPDQDPGRLADEFYRAAYGEAYLPMKRFFGELYGHLDRYRETRLPRDPEYIVTAYFPPKLLLRMEKNLRAALAMDTGPRVAARLRLVDKEFRYLKNLVSVFLLYNAYRLSPGWGTFDLLAGAIEERNRMIDSFYDENGKMKRFDGWPRFFEDAPKDVLRVNGRLTATLGAPFNWNTALLREKRVLPGSGRKRARAARIEGIRLDGRLDEAAWNELRSEELGEISLGELREPTTFKVAYDDEAVYFGFACHHSAVDEMKIDAVGTDGPAYRQECLEIFLDASGTGERYCHFIFNPVPNSRYDERKGFIDDPLHPLYNKGDRSWNGEWEYAAHIDRANKRWAAEVRIPFAALGAAVPKAGDCWGMNVGREHYSGTNFRGSTKQELSLWSPNLESRSFQAPEAFGDLTFE